MVDRVKVRQKGELMLLLACANISVDNDSVV
jgi:hypothetical protein